MYESAKSIFQQKLKDTIKSDSAKDVIQDVIKLHLFKNAEKNEALLSLVEVYDLLGLEKFTELISLLEGKTITFPKKDDFKDTVQLAVCYYYRVIEHKTWDELKVLLGDDELPSIKYGIRIQQFQSFLQYIATKMKNRKDDERKDRLDVGK